MSTNTNKRLFKDLSSSSSLPPSSLRSNSKSTSTTTTYNLDSVSDSSSPLMDINTTTTNASTSPPPFSSSDVTSAFNDSSSSSLLSAARYRPHKKHMIVFITQAIMCLILMLAAIINLSLREGHTALWASLLSASLGLLMPNPSVKSLIPTDTSSWQGVRRLTPPLSS